MNIITVRATILAAACSALASCADTATSTATSPNAALTTPTPAQQACLRDVTATTQNPDVRVIDSSFSEAGTEVIVGVGPTGRWRCIAYEDGTTAGIESMTDEGSL